MDPRRLFNEAFTAHQQVAQRTQQALVEDFVRLCHVCRQALDNGGKLVWFGNGGSAADAQHLATELVVRYARNRPPLAAIALTTDTSALTAIGNDLGFAHLFARQIEALCRPGDVAIALSTSGTSANIIAGLHQARQCGVTAAGLSGRDGGEMIGLAEPLLIVPSTDTARIQEMHITLGHMLCAVLEGGEQ